MAGPRPGDPVFRSGKEPLGRVIDPSDPTPHAGSVAMAQIIPELSDRKLFARSDKQSILAHYATPGSGASQMHKLFRTDVGADRTPLEWLELRDSFVNLCQDPAVRGDLCRLAAWPGVPVEVAYQTIPRLARTLCHARVTVWQPDRWDAAISGAKVFEETALEPGDSYGGPELWLMERGPILEPPGLGLDRPVQVTAILIVGSREGQKPSGPDGLTWFIFGAPELPKEWWGSGQVETRNKLAEDPVNWMPRIKTLPGIAYGEPVLPYAAPLVAAGKFMRQVFIEHRIEPMPRQQRRHYERKQPEHTSAVYALTLRRTDYRYDHKGTGTVDWKWQWLTDGCWVHPKHERYKNTEPFYRREHWKGPRDAPIKPPGERIYVVRK